MNRNVLGILQQINSLKVDINIHKEILSAIPDNEAEKIRETLAKIASIKDKIEKFRETLRQEDPDGYTLMIKLENATAVFQTLSKGKQFKKIFTLEHNGQCALDLQNGDRVDCLVAAMQASGDWTVITTAGDAREYMKSEVVFE